MFRNLMLHDLLTDVTQLFTAIGAIGAAIIGWINRKKIQNVHIELNDRLSQLLEKTKAAAFLSGRQHERDETNGNGK